MDSYDIFRKLTAGVRFNTTKFYNDAQRFQMVKSKPVVGPVFPVIKDEPKDEKPGRKKKEKTREQLIQQHKEKISHFRRSNRITVDGSDLPNPVESFSQLAECHGMSQQLLKNILSAGYDAPTPIQMQAIPVMLDRREILACAPTGSGKTAAFLLPLLHQLKGPQKKGFRAVIVAPTRELAKQILRECERLAEGTGLRVHYIRKAAGDSTGGKKLNEKKFDILVTTPNRLVFLLNQEPAGISLKNVEWLVVDESDKLFEAGRTGFRDQLAIIYKACDSAGVRRAMFSATFAHEVEQWCRMELNNVVMVNVGARNAAADLVQQELTFVGNESGKLIAFRDLIRKGLEPPVLVFVQSKDRARELFNELIYDGINVDVIHAERTQLQRDNTVRSFRRGQIWVLICTELMGRGMDFKGVNLVVNYDFPPTAVSYIHRIGRTGRAGRPGKAVTFFTEDDVICLRSIAQVMRDSGCEVPAYMLKLKKLPRQLRRQMDKHPIKRGHVTPRAVRNMSQKKLRTNRRGGQKKRDGEATANGGTSQKAEAASPTKEGMKRKAKGDGASKVKKTKTC